MNSKPFFSYARERYKIYLRRDMREPKPWTQDKILQQYRFTNVFRELDRTTIWFRRNFRSRSDVTVFSCVAFRFFGRIETGEKLLALDLLADWNPKLAREKLAGVKPLVTGAYVVNTPGGKNKLNGIIEILDPVWQAQQEGLLDFHKGTTLEEAHSALTVYPFVGKFMAQEAVMDLRFTPVLKHAPDWGTWASAGPGCARGLARLLGENVDHFNYGCARDQKEMLKHILYLLDQSRKPNNWPTEFPKLDAHSIQFTCCEFDKYSRVKAGGRMKQRYHGT